MKTKNLITLLFLSLAIVSCSDDFLDVNQNPNSPPISTPSLTLPVAQQNFAALNGTSMVFLGQYMVYNWTTPSNWSANQTLLQYDITSNFYTTIFETSYSSIFRDLTYVKNYVDPTGAADYSAYDVIAETIKGFQYQYLVDLYGDVPYTEANLRSGNTTPKYDDSEFIYKAVIDSLTDAAVLALDLPENAEDPGSQDIIYHGDMQHWAEFANTVKLRMLVRMSNTGQDDYIRQQIALINQNGAGYIKANVVANPGYSDNAGQQSPFYGYIGKGPNGAAIDRNDYTVATDFALSYLDGTADLRKERLYAEAATGGYKGAEQRTDLPGTGFTSNNLSKVGPGLLKSSEQDQVIMLYSEALLLQAEAMVRGYIDGGEAGAKALYEKAIEQSFVYLGVPSAVTAAKAYYAQPIKNVSWDASPNKIEAIITQKWIALNGTSSIESWVEWIRTGYPANLPLARNETARPVSLLYPASEIGRNSDNVPQQTAADAFTNDPFWR